MVGRPQKFNADYFPHKSYMRNNIQVKVLRNKYGNEGYAVFMMLMEVLADSDYFKIKWDEDTKTALAIDFLITDNLLSEIVDLLIRRELLQETDGYLHCKELGCSLEAVLYKRKFDKKQFLHSKNELMMEESQKNLGDSDGNIEDSTKVKKSKVKQSKVNIIDINEIKSLEGSDIAKGLMIYIQEKTNQVKLLKNQLNIKEAESIAAAWQREQVKAVLSDMDNYNPLLSKYKSVYLTMLKWLKNDVKWQSERGGSKNSMNTQFSSSIPAN